ncbi:response regulator [Roseinatronobacter sp. NSM]|uniref:response regulator n=1 Tax=Roseinatronobacter sp. NSM TaxID=3457785 RepID=UPI004035E92B
MEQEQVTMAAQQVRIVVTEDDDPVRRRFVSLLSDWDGCTLVANCATLAATEQVIRTHQFDLLITDCNLPDGSGIDAIALLRRLQPQAEAMVISVLADELTVLDAVKAGATGYLLKDAGSIDLIEAIRELLVGHSPISPRIARLLMRKLGGPSQQQHTPQMDGSLLTAREMDILWGIAKGFTNAEIAERLGISRQTVPVHIRNIYRKLETTTRTETVFEASRLGLIQL